MKDIISFIIYLFILLIFGYIVGHAISKECFPIREGARTLPRPVINPPYKTDVKEVLAVAVLPGETMNQFIDKQINIYFDKDGLPLEKTIQKYVSYCVNQGNVSEENKRKLTDIGYYFLNIVIPNLPSTKNNQPKEYWPPIQWSNHNIFDVWKQPTPTYKEYKGQNYLDSYVSNFNGSRSGGGGNINSLFGNLDTSDFFGYSKKDDGSGNDGDGGDGDECDSSPQSKCGIGCPDSCLNGAFAAAADAQNGENEDGSSSGNQNNMNMNESYQFDRENHYKNRGKQVGNTTFLPGGANVLIIGSAKLDGYVITDEKQTSDSTKLNDEINEFIYNYFISSGPNENRPTQYAIDQFEILKKKAPMDEIHMNKLRDMVYYVLQIIIPGLPTDQLPRSYVAWRPIVWMSRSEKRNSV
jgi:hypothetical protein